MATSSRRATERRKTYFARKERKHGAGRTGGGVRWAAHPARPLLRQRRGKLGGVTTELGSKGRLALTT